MESSFGERSLVIIAPVEQPLESAGRCLPGLRGWGSGEQPGVEARWKDGAGVRAERAAKRGGGQGVGGASPGGYCTHRNPFASEQLRGESRGEKPPACLVLKSTMTFWMCSALN